MASTIASLFADFDLQRYSDNNFKIMMGVILVMSYFAFVWIYTVDEDQFEETIKDRRARLVDEAQNTTSLHRDPNDTKIVVSHLPDTAGPLQFLA